MYSGTPGEEAGQFEETMDTEDRAKIAEHEDEMQFHEEWTETRTQFYQLEAVKHMQTGEILTFVEAVRQGLLDLRSGEGEFFDIVSGSKISLQDAVERGYVSQSFNDCLQTRYGIYDPKTGDSLTLIEAIQRGIYDPESRQLRDPDAGDLLSLPEAVSQRVISWDNVANLIRIGVLKLPPVPLDNAIEQGTINVETGVFVGRYSKEQLQLKDALRQGYISLQLPHPPMIAISLTECVENRFINPSTGEFTDKNSDDKFTLRDAVSRTNNLINLNLPEIVNTQDRKRLTVSEAVVRNVLNTRQGNFTDLQQRVSLTILEAYERDLIQKPMNLKEILRKDLVDSTGKFIDAGTKKRLTMLEAIAEGLLDAEVRHILDPEEQDVISVAEALERGILDPQSYFIDEERGPRRLQLHEAAQRNYFVDPVRYTVFDVKAVKNTKTGATLSFNEAVDASIIILSSERFVDLLTKDSYMLDDVANRGLVDPMLHKILTSPSGIKDRTGIMTVFKAVATGFIDPKKGILVDKNRNNMELNLQEAYDRGVVTLRGAMQLAALFNVHPTLVSVVRSESARKKKKRGAADFMKSPAEEQAKVTLAEALRSGMIDAKTQRFRQGGQEMSLQEALNRGIVDPNSEWIVPAKGKGVGPTIQETTTESVVESNQVLEPKQTTDSNIEESVSTVKRQRVTETTATGGPGGVAYYKSITAGRGSLEVPASGLPIAEAQRRGILDTNSGLITVPNSDRTLTLQEACDLGIIQSSGVTVHEPKTGKQVTLSEAFEEQILEPTGHIVDPKSGRKLSFQAAIDAEYVRVGPDTRIQPGAPTKTIQFGAGPQMGPVMSYTPVGTATFEENQEAWSFDAKTGEVMDGLRGTIMSLDEAVKSGKVPAESVFVKDVLTDRTLSYSDACRWGIIEPGTNIYVDKQYNRRYTLKEAAQKGLITLAGIAQGAGANQVTEGARQTTVRSQTRKVVATKEATISAPAAFVDYSLQKLLQLGMYNETSGTFTHPDTKRELTLKEAIVKGLFNPYESVVENQTTGESLTLLDAIQVGVIDADRGQYVNLQNGERMSLRKAVERGLIRSAGTGALMPAGRGGAREASGAVSRYEGPGGREKVVDLGAGKQALVKVVRGNDGVERGEYVDPDSGMKFTIQLHGDPYQTTTQTTVKSSAQVQAVELEPHAELIGIDKVRDKRTGRVMSLVEAQRTGLAKVDKKGKQLTRTYAVFRSDISHAVKRGVVDPTNGDRVSLEDAIHAKLIDLNTLQYSSPLSSEKMSLSQAANMGLLDVTLAEVLPKGIVNPANGERISVRQGIDIHIINPVNGQVQNPFTRQPLTWMDLLKPVYSALTSEGVYDPRKGYSVPLTSALNEGLLDTRAETYNNPITGERLSLDEAGKKGLIDEDTLQAITKPSVKDWHSGRQVNLLEAVNLGIVDPANRTVQTDRNETMPIARAAEQGKIPKNIASKMKRVDKIAFIEALGKGLIDVASNQFSDPDTGKKMTIAQALEQGYIDTGSVESLEGRDERNLANVINSDEFEEKSGRIHDNKSGLYLTFRQAIERNLIDGDSLIYDTETGKTMTVSEAIGQGRIDSQDGKYRDSKTGNKVTLKDAVRAGLIALIASPMQAGQAVAEAVKRREAEGFKFRLEEVEDEEKKRGGRGPGYYEETVTKFNTRRPEPTLSLKVKSDDLADRVHSILNDPLAISDRQYEFLSNLEQKGFNVDEPLVLNPASGKQISVRDAVHTGLLDVITGMIIHPTNKRHYSIPNAVHLKYLPAGKAKEIMESLNISLEELISITQSLSSPSRRDIFGGSPSGYSPTLGRSREDVTYQREVNWHGDPGEFRPGGDMARYTKTQGKIGGPDPVAEPITITETREAGLEGGPKIIHRTTTTTSYRNTGGPQEVITDESLADSDDEKSLSSEKTEDDIRRDPPTDA